VAIGKTKATATTAMRNASDIFIDWVGLGCDIAIPPPYNPLIMN
jgi:hypothetical protein